MLHVVLYQPEIPPNTGNIGRSCLAIGAKLWLIRPLGFKMDDRSLKRAGMDYWHLVDCQVVDSWEHLRAELPGHRFWFLTKFANKLVWDAQ
ncbi:MAG: tRNA (uridine(34)/cytosine(34)/5-carboxymethylaminomethyluridine(34)-2'-O)-methyltransferase TrmL, partial [Planctomycetaceae bacterium]|nr:tRNA (uridine(34)/cytosine(34)/5-carboxymethylaminomethyluridine(34)-2'-O)-methyltransferase TrmL [Planctomycetaceae bacterium]